MRTLTAQDILAVWEAGLERQPVERALVALERALPDWPRERLARLPLGRRDQLLLELRAQLFGDALSAFTRCPSCRESLELPLSVAGICGQGTTGDGQSSAFRLHSDGLEIRFRLPNSEDEEEAARQPDQEAGRAVLLERCIAKVRDGKRVVPVAQLPESAVAVLATRMAELDPLAELSFSLTCPNCGQEWDEVLDPATYLWAEIAAAAQHLLAEVHTLAQSYGWRESDVLALSASRRNQYLELVGS
jgi:hypothetical protein